MAENFQITIRHEDGALYFGLWGDFDGISAVELVYTLREKARVNRKIYVETDGISQVLPFGKHLLQAHFDLYPSLTGKVIFLGKNGLKLIPKQFSAI